MSHNGQVIWTFSSVEEARQACIDWHNLVDDEPVIIDEEDCSPTGPIPSAA